MGPTPAKRRGPAPIIIIAAVIVILVFCWIFGRGCGGNQQAKENEKLRTYTSTANKLIQRSAAVGVNFDGLRKGVKDLVKEDVNRKLTQMVSDCKSIGVDLAKVAVPKYAQNLQQLLQLSFDLRFSGTEQFRASIGDILNKKSTDNSAAVMQQGLMDLVVSDELLQRFRGTLEGKLKAAKLSFEKVADSTYVPKKEDALAGAVTEYLGDLRGTETGSELHGVALTELSTSPARVDRTESGVSVVPYSSTFSVKVAVQNQGNQEEDDVPVVATLTSESEGTPQKKTEKIAKLKPGETTTIVFEGLKPLTGPDKVNILKVVAGPVPHEKKTENNEQEYQFIMRAEGAEP